MPFPAEFIFSAVIEKFNFIVAVLKRYVSRYAPVSRSAYDRDFHFLIFIKKFPAVLRQGIRNFCLIIFGVDFKIRLRVGACRAEFRGFRSDDDVSAVAALPDFDLALCENLLGLDVL